MIINVRGTSGSGKSTLVRSVMSEYKQRSAVKIKGRRQPLMYILSGHPFRERSLAVLGHYETPCGGCDTISKTDEIISTVEQSVAAGHDVLFEGLLISTMKNQLIDMHEAGYEIAVVSLGEVPVEACISSVNERRLQRLGEEKYTPVNPKGTTSKHATVARTMTAFEEAGMTTFTGNRDTALKFVQGMLDNGSD